MIARAITQPFLSADSNAAAQASTGSKATSRPIGHRNKDVDLMILRQIDAKVLEFGPMPIENEPHPT